MKWIEIHKWNDRWRFGGIVLFDRIQFFYGEGSYFGLGIELDIEGKSLLIHVLKWYFGVELWLGKR